MSGGGSDEADEMNRKLDEQQRQADADKESHRASLEKMRMNVVKSVGGQEFYPDKEGQAVVDSMAPADNTDTTNQQ